MFNFFNFWLQISFKCCENLPTPIPNATYFFKSDVFSWFEDITSSMKCENFRILADKIYRSILQSRKIEVVKTCQVDSFIDSLRDAFARAQSIWIKLNECIPLILHKFFKKCRIPLLCLSLPVFYLETTTCSANAWRLDHFLYQLFAYLFTLCLA